jgi:glycosyltransferase involved in cell wall biosynthesis
MKMAEALSAVVPGTMLIARRGDKFAEVAGLEQLYGVGQMPALHLLRAGGRFGIHLFNLRAALIARRLGAALVLSRSIGAAAIAARLGLPTIWECHAPPEGFERRYWSLLTAAPAFRRLVVISDALRRLMSERHPELASHEVIVAHDGVDKARFADTPSPEAAKRAARRDPARPVAAYAGHLYAGRGIEVILGCAAVLPQWSFLIIGGLPADIAAVERQCRKTALNNIELLGFIDNAELPERLAAADVLLMPYQRRVMVSGGRLDTAAWMSPLKMFEYMAMGRPIVASDLPVLREVLDESCAFLVRPDDVSGWVDALQSLRDPSLRERLAGTAKARAAQYDWSVRVRQVLTGLIADQV